MVSLRMTHTDPTQGPGFTPDIKLRVQSRCAQLNMTEYKICASNIGMTLKWAVNV